MVQFEELLLKLQALKPEIDDLSDALGMKGMLSEIQQLELKATEPGFWDDALVLSIAPVLRIILYESRFLNGPQGREMAYSLERG